MIINESNVDILRRVSQLTLTDYEVKWFNTDDIEGYINAEEIVYMIGDLINEIEQLEEKIRNMEQDIQDNYRPIPVSEQVGISDKDFI